MKVIYLTAFEFNGSNAASKRVINNINALTNQGMNVTVLSAGSFKSFEELNKIKRPFKSICIYEKPSNHKEKLTLFDRFLGIFKVFSLLKESKDITHIILYSGYSPYAFMLLILRQFKKFKIIFDSVEWYLPNHALDVLSLKNIDSNLANRFLLHYFDGIFAISKYLGDHFKKGIFLTKKAKILLLPPLIEEKEYLQKDLILNNGLELVYAGNIGPNKDRLENVFKALFLLLDEGYQIKFTLVGDNEENLSKIEYYVLVKGHFPESLKVINKNISLEESERLIKDAHYVIYFRNENRISLAGFPTKFVESLSCSTPVITNSIGDIGGYLLHKKNGLIAENNFEEIKQILLIAIHMSNKEYQKLSESAHKTSLKFAYQNYEKEIKNFLEELN
ncbi:MAG: hypothetical protein CMI87_04810 [Pelagibacteraceae bacterium]|nr:hypothetical protein [Pelagibacteraceae bacterium]